jgi:hypothetical protein
VPDSRVRWEAAWGEYDPPEHTDHAVISNSRDAPTGHKWADPPSVLGMRTELDMRVTTSASDDGEARTLADAVDYEPRTGAPLNPRGRTGLAGRGLLGKWG